MERQLTIIGSGQYNYDTIKLREYPEGFVPGRKNAFVERNVAEEVGGTCGNVMCILSHLGWDARPQLKLGEFAEAEKLVESLREFGCDTRFVTKVYGGGFSGLECSHRRNKTTGAHELALRPYGPNGSRFAKIAELRARDEAPAFLSSLDETPDVYFFDHGEAGPRMIAEELRRRGALVYYECENCSDWKKFEKCIAVADIVKFSEESVAHTDFCENYPDKLFIQTMGAKGMRFRLPHGEWKEVAPVAVENVVDWEGCGDTTTAVFLNELGKIGLPKIAELKEEQVRSALEIAAEKAALCTQYYGSKTWLQGGEPDAAYPEIKTENKMKDKNEMRADRREVFRHTMQIVKNGGYTVDGRTVDVEGSFDIYYRTKVYRQEFKTDAPKLETPTVVEVLNEDCLVAAKQLLDEGLNPAVLNLASRRNPGGGVVNGAAAQEENLFRRTNLFLSMFPLGMYAAMYKFPESRLEYPLDPNWGGVYTKAVTVFKGTEKDGYPLLAEPFQMDFIAVAAINHPDLDTTGMLTPPMAEATKRKMRTIFRIGLDNSNDSLVLGAMGCGAFHNPTAHIARLFHEVMQEPEFLDRYKKILFAIIEDRNSGRSFNPDGNFLPFEREFATKSNE